MRRIFITGGTGYLGSTLVRQAAAHSWRVAASYHSQPPPADGHDWAALDLRDSASVAEAFARFKPEIVIHTAFRQYEPDLYVVTATGAQHVAQASHALGARLIHLSSDVIFAGEATRPYREDDAPSPITDYGAAKADAEQFVAAEHPEAAIVRTSLIYGFAPIDRQTRFVLDLARGKAEGRLFSDEMRCPIYVENLAAALLELATLDYAGVLNVAGGETLSRYEFGLLMAQACGVDPSRLTPGLSAESGARRPRNCALDISRAQALLRTPLPGVRAVVAARAAHMEQG